MSGPSSMWSSRPPPRSRRPPVHQRILRAFEVWLAGRDTPWADDEPVLPRDPIVPVFAVEEVRYDLEHATVTGLLSRGFEAGDRPAPYEGLTDRESELLCDARCELVEWRERLGG